ncbi:hypothetical protein HDU96_003704 [Phlyctochytrium bullatum]|nr:hypothetical protein HDU96_003704 [Phlyctochytrium bullatum]
MRDRVAETKKPEPAPPPAPEPAKPSTAYPFPLSWLWPTSSSTTPPPQSLTTEPAKPQSSQTTVYHPASGVPPSRSFTTGPPALQREPVPPPVRRSMTSVRTGVPLPPLPPTASSTASNSSTNTITAATVGAARPSLQQQGYLVSRQQANPFPRSQTLPANPYESTSPTSPLSASSSSLSSSLVSPVRQPVQGRGRVYIARDGVQPLDPDEVELEAGDPIQVDTVYADGWCKGVNLRTRQYGFVSLAYLSEWKTGKTGACNKSQKNLSTDKKQKMLDQRFITVAGSLNEALDGTKDLELIEVDRRAGLRRLQGKKPECIVVNIRGYWAREDGVPWIRSLAPLGHPQKVRSSVVSLGIWGATLLLTAGYFLEPTPIARRDIFQNIPIIGAYWKEKLEARERVD